MNQRHHTKAIVLSRIDYGESDRILTLLTPHLGKLHLLAKGVRKEKSKMAGGIELFCLVEVGYITGRGELGTLISSNLVKFYSNILKDINKVQLMYQILKTFDKTTEDNVEEDYYHLLNRLLELADLSQIDYHALELYYKAHLLKLTGHVPNLKTDAENNKLEESGLYSFDFSSMSMRAAKNGRYNSKHLKYLRLLFADISDNRFLKLQKTEKIALDVVPLIDAMMKSTLSI